MNAAHTRFAHVLDYSAANFKGDGARACQNEIVRFVSGVRKNRKNPVTADQIAKWFRATPSDFVHQQIATVVAEGRIRCMAKSFSSSRRANGQYVYEAA